LTLYLSTVKLVFTYTIATATFSRNPKLDSHDTSLVSIVLVVTKMEVVILSITKTEKGDNGMNES